MFKPSATFFSLFNYVRPNVFVKRIEDINPLWLKKLGIKYVFCDLDNTLVPHFTAFPTKSSMDFLEALHKLDIKLIVISNNRKKRVEKFCMYLSPDDFVYNAKKPLLGKFKKVMKKYNINADDAIMMGDQFITDIWTANRLGIRSILVLPIVSSMKNTSYHDENNILMRFLETYIYKKIQLTNALDNITNKLK